MVIATCKSSRNLETVARFVRKVYKIKRSNQIGQSRKLGDVPKIDGLKAKSPWLAIDMGKKKDIFTLPHCPAICIL